MMGMVGGLVHVLDLGVHVYESLRGWWLLEAQLYRIPPICDGGADVCVWVQC